MTRVFEAAQPAGGLRMLVLGAGHYPFASVQKPKVPVLPDIGSAARSAMDFARGAISDWQANFAKPLASIDLLVNDANYPDGTVFQCAGMADQQLQAPTLPKCPSGNKLSP